MLEIPFSSLLCMLAVLCLLCCLIHWSVCRLDCAYGLRLSCYLATPSVVNIVCSLKMLCCVTIVINKLWDSHSRVIYILFYCWVSGIRNEMLILVNLLTLSLTNPKHTPKHYSQPKHTQNPLHHSPFKLSVSFFHPTRTSYPSPLQTFFPLSSDQFRKHLKTSLVVRKDADLDRERLWISGTI